MTANQVKLEQFLNRLEGKIIAIIPNVMVTPFTLTAQWIRKKKTIKNVLIYYP